MWVCFTACVAIQMFIVTKVCVSKIPLFIVIQTSTVSWLKNVQIHAIFLSYVFLILQEIFLWSVMTWSIPTISCYVLWISCMEMLCSVLTVKNSWILILRVCWKKKVDLKYMRINIFCIWLCNSNSINVVCNNRLVNFVNNTLSQEFDVLWKYPWRKLDSNNLSWWGFSVSERVHNDAAITGHSKTGMFSWWSSLERPRAQTGDLFLSHFWIAAVLFLKRMEV